MASQEQQVSTLNMNPNQSQPVLHPNSNNNNNTNSHNKNLSSYGAPPAGQHQRPPFRKKSFNPNTNERYGHQNGGGGYYGNRNHSYQNYPMNKPKNFRQDSYSRPYNNQSNTTDLNSAGNSSNTNSTTPPTPSSATSPNVSSMSTCTSEGTNVVVDSTNVDAATLQGQTEEDGQQVDPSAELQASNENAQAAANNLVRDLNNLQLGQKQQQSGERHTAPYQPYSNSVNMRNDGGYHHYGKSHSPHDMIGSSTSSSGGPSGKPASVSGYNSGYQGYYSSRSHHSQIGSGGGNKVYNSGNYSNSGLSSTGNYQSNYSNKLAGGKVYNNNSNNGNYPTNNKLGGGGYRGKPPQSHPPAHSLNSNGKPSSLNQSNQNNNILLRNGQPNHSMASQQPQQHPLITPANNTPQPLYYQSSAFANNQPSGAGHHLNQSQGAQMPNLHNPANCIQCLSSYGAAAAAGQFMAPPNHPNAYTQAFYPAAQFIAPPYQYNATAAGIQQQQQPLAPQQQQLATSNNQANLPLNKQHQYMQDPLANNPLAYYYNPAWFAPNLQQFFALQQASMQQANLQQANLHGQQANQEQFVSAAGSVSGNALETSGVNADGGDLRSAYDSGGGGGGLLQTATTGYNGGDQNGQKFAYSNYSTARDEYNPINQMTSQTWQTPQAPNQLINDGLSSQQHSEPTDSASAK